MSSAGLSRHEIEIIKFAFDKFDTNKTGKIDPAELKEALIDMEYDKKNPGVFEIIAGMDTKDNFDRGGVAFFEFIDEINQKLKDRQNQQSLRRIYDIFVDETGSINKDTLKNICKDIALSFDDEELKVTLDRLARNGTTVSFEDFCDLAGQTKRH